ncbi:MAG: winged helix-turn-helix transcriptional regulator [Dehalococcoidales bacterium]|nr:winged helix-turn-helix transcriptional regulator [Dehalococcoidales bacterium]
MSEWTFLTNHAIVLSYLSIYPRITARELSNAIGITERATRKIIADLLQNGYISKDLEGRRNRYHINPDLPLRHPGLKETAVGYLLEILGWKRRGRPRKAK